MAQVIEVYDVGVQLAARKNRQPLKGGSSRDIGIRIASMSLEQALSELWDEFTPGGARYKMFVLGTPKALKPAIKEQIYLIGREAVLNALRHSGAAAIEAEVEYSARRLRVFVRDNGCGMDPQVVRSSWHSHRGLLGMREQAESAGARLRIWSAPGGGTEVEISCSDPYC